jgi:hypothetical protein
MSDYLDWLRQGSAEHAVTVKRGVITVTPLGASAEACHAFQPIAEKILRLARAGEFEAKSYETSKWPGKYGRVDIWPNDD